MRTDGTFIGIEVSDAIAGDAAVAAKLREVCPGSTSTPTPTARSRSSPATSTSASFCRLCIDATSPEQVKVLKLWRQRGVAGLVAAPQTARFTDGAPFWAPRRRSMPP